MSLVKAFTPLNGIKDQFDFSRFLPIISPDVEPSQDSLRSPFFDRFPQLRSAGSFTVPEYLSNDAAAIARRVYGTSELWWLLCFYNQIDEPYNIPTGSVLNIFPLLGLEFLLGEIKSLNISLAPTETLLQKIDLKGIASTLLMLYYDSDLTFIRSSANSKMAVIVIDDTYCGYISSEGVWLITGDLWQLSDDYSLPVDDPFIAYFANESLNGIRSMSAPVETTEDGVYLSVLRPGFDLLNPAYEPLALMSLNYAAKPSLPMNLYYRGDLATPADVGTMDAFLAEHGIDGKGFTPRVDFLGFSLDGESYCMAFDYKTGIPRLSINSFIATNHNPLNESCVLP